MKKLLTFDRIPVDGRFEFSGEMYLKIKVDRAVNETLKSEHLFFSKAKCIFDVKKETT